MAYGARLESVLGASPHGFESHILRTKEKCPRLSSGAFWLSNQVRPSQTQKEKSCTKQNESQAKTQG